MNSSRKLKRRAFTLVEMLAVIAIIGVVSALVIPALTGLGQGSSLTTTGQSVLDQFVTARQTALSRNRNTEVRFYTSRSTLGSGFLGTQVWCQVLKNGVVSYQPIGKFNRLRDGFKIMESNKYSPLIGPDFTGYKNTDNLPKESGATDFYMAVRFRATGAPEASLNPTNNFITVAAERESGNSVPNNYFAAQIDPLTGRVVAYRP